MHAIQDEFPAYGYRRITAQRRAEGVPMNRKRVARLMCPHGMQVRPRRRLVVTTDSDHDEPIFSNLAKSITPEGPDQLPRASWRPLLRSRIGRRPLGGGHRLRRDRDRCYLPRRHPGRHPPPSGGIRFANRIDGLLTIDGRGGPSATRSAAPSRRCRRHCRQTAGGGMRASQRPRQSGRIQAVVATRPV